MKFPNPIFLFVFKAEDLENNIGDELQSIPRIFFIWVKSFFKKNEYLFDKW